MSISARFAISISVFLAFTLNMISAEISDVKFEQKGYAFPEEMLKYNMQTRKGENFDQKVLDDDIKRLFSTGNFLDVQVETAETADGKMNVTVKTISKAKKSKKFRNKLRITCDWWNDRLFYCQKK